MYIFVRIVLSTVRRGFVHFGCKFLVIEEIIYLSVEVVFQIFKEFLPIQVEPQRTLEIVCGDARSNNTSNVVQG